MSQLRFVSAGIEFSSIQMLGNVSVIKEWEITYAMLFRCEDNSRPADRAFL